MDLLLQILELLGVSIDALPGQGRRLLRLHTPLGPDALLAERAEVVEQIGPSPTSDDNDEAVTGFRIQLTALAVDADLPLDELVGQPVLLEMETANAGTTLRPWHGHVTQASLLGSDGGLARYELVIEPWLAFLRWRTDSFVFQDMTVPEIVEAVFARLNGQGRLGVAFRWDLADASVYPRRSLCTQYRESDLDFVSRLLAEEGLFWWVEHEGDANAEPFGTHTLVIADHNGAFQPGVEPSARFTQSGAASFSEDGLQQFGPRRKITADSVELASFDYRSVAKRPAGASGEACEAIDTPLTAVDVPGAYAYEDSKQGERLAQRWLEALQAEGQAWHGGGQLRWLAPGVTVEVQEHPLPQPGAFVALSLRHRARSNLGADAQAGLERWLGEVPAWACLAGRHSNHRDEPLYRMEFTAQPVEVPVRAPASAAGLLAKPAVRGTQTAIVVGLDAPLHTDRDHRVKVQFHWQRGAQSSHGLEATSEDNAPASDASGTWVRVATSLAGSNWGTVFAPRLGQEVVVAFIDGDIDRPVVTGGAYNGVGQAQANDSTDAQGNQVAAGAATATGNAPAWFPGEQAAGEAQGHDHPAVLQGHKSQELAASASGTGGYNQWVFDDTPGQNRIELSTTTAATRLQLGHLIQQRDNQRLQPRGHGFDLMTNAFAAVRAGSGALISTHARTPSTSGSQLMDAREARTALQSHQELQKTLSDSAQRHEVKAEKEPTPDKLPTYLAQQGLYDSLGATQSDGDIAFAAPDRPDLVFASPAGIVFATPANQVASVANVAMSSAQDINLNVQRHHATVAAGGAFFFAYGEAKNPSKPNAETGIKLHAATGSVSVQAASGQARFAADQNVEVASTADAVTVGAPEHVLLNGGGSAIEITKGAITITTGGDSKFLAAVKKLGGGAVAKTAGPVLPVAPPLEALPDEKYFGLRWNVASVIGLHPSREQVLDRLPFEIRDTSTGKVISRGQLSELGLTGLVITKAAQKLDLFIGDGDWRLFNNVSHPIHE
jgi:type VI secretion system secreted protein VgrG